MSVKLTKQERLYDEIVLAKAIFVAQAQDIDFGTITKEQLEETINDCFGAAVLVIDRQEKHANDI